MYSQREEKTTMRIRARRLKLIKSLDARKGITVEVEETEIRVQLRIVSWKCTRREVRRKERCV